MDLYLEPIPNIFKFLKRSEEIIHECTEHEPYDLFIAQDCGDTGRLERLHSILRQQKRQSASTITSATRVLQMRTISFLMQALLRSWYLILDEKKISREIAECIYVGIIHDTGVFQYSSTSAKTMNVAGRLMNMGIDFTEIVDKTFYTKTYQQNRIMGQALVQSRLELGGAVITSVVTKEQMEEFEVLPKHLDGIVSQLRVTKDVEGRYSCMGQRTVTRSVCVLTEAWMWRELPWSMAVEVMSVQQEFLWKEMQTKF